MDAGLYKSVVLVRGLVAIMARYEVDSAKLFGNGIEELSRHTDPLARIPLREWHALTRRAVALTGDRGLGLSLGGASDHMLQIVGQLALSCGTLREAMRMLTRYRLLLGNTISFDLIEEGDLAYFTCAPLVPHRELPEFDPEMVLSLAYRVALRFATRASQDAKEVWFAYPAPAHAARYSEVFRCPVRFDRARHAILFARQYLDELQPYPDGRTLEILREGAERMLAELRAPNLADQVRALLRSESDLHGVDASRVARMLKLHPRAFRRRLIEQKISWSELLNETRCRIACEELRRSDVSVREVAERLGFSEPSAFTRAFKRWTGKTPVEYTRAINGLSAGDADP